MASINFPNNPATGTVYNFGDYRYVFDGVKWGSVVKYGSSAVKIQSATAPAAPEPGLQWFDDVSGRTYFWHINEGTDQGQWIEDAPQGLVEAQEVSEAYVTAEGTTEPHTLAEWTGAIAGMNLLSNHNFLIQTPDDSRPMPSATPTSYPPGYQIFSGVFANETTGITNLTYIDGRVSFSGGDLYFSVPNTGGLEHVTDFVASVADFDGKPRTRGVSFALVGDEYRVTVGIDALTDTDGNDTLLGSAKFQEGKVADRHDTQAVSARNLGDYTDIVYKASGGNSAVENMIAGIPVATSVGKTCQCENGSIFNRTSNATGSINDYKSMSAVNVVDFGAKGAGLANDDRKSIQDAIDFATLNGSSLFIPPCDDFYNIASANPTDPESGLVFDADVGSLFGNSDLNIQGSYYKGVIKATTPLTNLVRVKKFNRFRMEDVYWNANDLCDYAMYSDTIDTNDYSPYWTVDGCRFQRGVTAGLSLSSFVSYFNKCIFGNCGIGLQYRGINRGPVTSTHFSNCYAQECSVGYEINFLTYGSMTACAADRCDLAYKMLSCYGVTMTSCGMENGPKAIEFYNARNVMVNSFYALDVGSESPSSPEPYLIEHVTGSANVTYSGIYINNIDSSKSYDYKLRVSSVGNGGENITILDDSIKREETSIVNNNSYEHRAYIVKFLWDQEDRGRTINVSTWQEMFDTLKEMQFKQINADVIINVTADIPKQSVSTAIRDIYRGSHKLIINGNNHSLGEWTFRGCDVSLNNCNFIVSGGGFNIGVTADNSSIDFNNCHFTNSGNAGAAINGKNNSRVSFGGTSSVIGIFGNGGTYEAFNDSDGTTVWDISPVDVVTNLNLPVGMVVGTTGTTSTLISCKVFSAYYAGSPNWKLI